MIMKPSLRPAGLGALLLLCAATAFAAVPPRDGSPPSPSLPRARPGPPPLMALAGLERGLWELRERGVRSQDGGAAERICVRHPSQLMQMRHRDAKCRYFVIADQPSRAVITYQCEGSGTGRTDLRIETSRLVQIEAQGVDDGAPFVMLLEGRRVGDCR